jgi:hypothetical protein
MTHKKHEQLRAPFSDYTPENQERDAEKFLEAQKKDVYIVKVNGVYGAFLPRKICPISTNSHLGQSLAEFVQDVDLFFKEELKIIPRFRCVLNKGIEDHLRQQIEIQRLLDSGSRGNR